MIFRVRVVMICDVLQLLQPLIRDYKQKDGFVGVTGQLYGEELLTMELTTVVKMKMERTKEEIKGQEFHLH